MTRPAPRSHGTGAFEPQQLGALGADCVLEAGVLVFHPERVFLGDRVYVGHRAILKGYWKGELRIGDGTWIGQDCFLHGAGGLFIGEDVGIGPGVRIITSTHQEVAPPRAIMEGALEFAPVHIGAGSDLGVGAIVLPGVTIGRGVQVGAGAVVDKNLPDHCVAAGVPARVLRFRGAS